VARHVGLTNVDAEPLDYATSLDDGAARFPERAPFLRAKLDGARCKSEGAALWLDLAHSLSVSTPVEGDIRAAPESDCGLLLKREHGERDRAQRHHADQGNHNGRLAAVGGVLTHEGAVTGEHDHQDEER
jgi:hypothetical protein